MIFIDRLEGGAVQKIDVLLASDFFEINESDLRFNSPVKIVGEAYITDDDLVLHFSASTIVQMTCSICNAWVPMTLAVKNFYHTEPLTGIAGGQFNFLSTVRESLLVELPKIAECNSGNCPQREAISPYLKKAASQDALEHYFPFNDLKLP